MLRCRGKSYLDLLAQRAGACEDAPDAVVAPGRPRPGAGGRAGVCARRASRSCRSAAARAWSAAWSRLAARSPRWCRSTSRAWTGCSSVDERSLTAVLRAGHPAARGRPRARRARPHARPRAAELRVGDGRRLRRDPLGGPGLDRPRPDRREPRRRALRDAARRAGDAARCRPAPPGRRCASVVAGSEGALGVITSAALRVHPLPEAQRFEGWFAPGVRGRLRRAPAARAGAARRPTWRACRTRTRRASRSRWPVPARSRARRSARACAARPAA